MARKIRRKPKKKLIVIIIVLALILIGLGAYFMLSNKPTVKKNKVVSKIPEYGYTLKSNKSSAYKKLFQELKKVLSKDKVDEEEYAKTITEMFIVDFYSLKDHIAKTDVGGVDFVHKDAEANFIENAEDTMYKYVESNIYGQRKQKLPEVDKVTIKSVEKSEFTYGDVTDSEALEVVASWTYKNESIAEGYQTDATFIYMHDGKKLVLAELQNGEEDDDEEEEDLED